MRRSKRTPARSVADPQFESLLKELPAAHAAVVAGIARERADLLALADRRAEQLRRLQEASTTLSRMLERDDIEREVARQASRVVRCAGAVVARQPADGAIPAIDLHWQDGAVRTANGASCTLPALAEVTRSGRPSRAGESGASVLAVPIRTGHRAAGVLAVYGEAPLEFGADDEELLITLGATAAAALATGSFIAESLRDKRQSEALSELARALASTHRLGEVLHLGLRHTTAILGAEGSAISLVKDEFLHIVAATGSAAPIQGMFIPIEESATGRAMREGRTLLINDITEAATVYERARQLAGVEKVIGVPLLTPDGPIGVVTVMNRVADFVDEDVRVLERLASQLAVAVVKVRLYEEASDATRELSSAFDAIAGGMAVLDSEGFVVRHNARLRLVAGVDDGQPLVGRSLYELLLKRPSELTDEDPVGAAIRRRVVGRGVLRPEGSERVFEVVASPHPSGGAVATVDDVSTFLALSERYRLVVESTADAILITARDGTTVFSNIAAHALFGRTVERDRTHIVSLVPHELRTEFEGRVARALRGATLRFNGEVQRDDGERRVVSMSLAPMRSGDQVTGLVASLRDMTDETRARDALEVAEARFARLVQSAEDAICTLDEEGSFTSLNRAMVRALGRPREELLGRHFTDFLEAEERGGMWLMFAASLDGSRQRGELRFRLSSHAWGIGSVISAPLIEHGRITGVLAIIRDVTEERALLEGAARREKLAALGELVGGVAHEVNSPLTGILAFGQLLQGETGLNDDARRAADTIVNEAKRAARIVGKLLTFARQNPTERTVADLNQVLQDTIELRRYPLRMQEVALDVQLAKDLPVTWADPFQLQQVFINLLSNAEQSVSQRKGTRCITVRSERRGDALAVSVADNGPGIAPGDLPHIFNPFYTTKPRGSGTGLGLSISFGIVREHGGSILASSEPGAGATFTVTLPIVSPPRSGSNG